MSYTKGNKREARRVLLLGGFGTVGLAVWRQLEDAGYEVYAPNREDLDLADQDTASYWRFLLPQYDVVINCAGCFEYNLETDYEEMMAVNFRCNYEIIDHYLHGFPKDKDYTNTNVIFVGSSAFNKSNPNYILYGASKSALCSMVMSCGNNDILRSKNVRVNVVNPGPIRGTMSERAGKDQNQEDLLTPEEVAEFIIIWAETNETGKVINFHRGS